VAIGVRRLLSRENIYTIKLVARRHFIPKALHANMFLVRPAGDVMDRDILVLPKTMPFDEFLRMPEHKGKFRHVVVSDGERIAGVLRVNTGLRRGLEGSYTGVTLGEVALKEYVVARESDIMFQIIGRAWRKKAAMILVVNSSRRVPKIADVTGVIAKEQIADSVAESVRPYASESGTVM